MSEDLKPLGTAAKSIAGVDTENVATTPADSGPILEHPDISGAEARNAPTAVANAANNIKFFFERIMPILILVVAITSLTVATLAYFRQGERWKTEDERAGPRVFFALDGSVRPDGWRRGVLQVTNRQDIQLLVRKLVLSKPSGGLITSEYQSQGEGNERFHPVLERAADHIDFNEIIQAYIPNYRVYENGRNWGAAFYLKSSGESGDEVVLEFYLREVPYPHHEWILTASQSVP